MTNPLYNSLGGNNDGGFSKMLNELENFKNKFTGNPTEKVQQLLNSNQMSQEQYNQLSQMAHQIVTMLPRN